MYTVLNRDFVYNNVSAVYFTNAKIFDDRGFFTVGFNKDAINNEVIKDFNVIQHNISNSSAGIARGLHFQIENNQAKIVHCLQGCAIDIIVDMRVGSPFFGKGKAYLLDNINTYLYVPHGFAHGFVTYSEMYDTMFEYFVDDVWNKNSEYVLDMESYLNGNNIYVANTKNEIKTLIPFYIKNNNFQYSEKDTKIAKKYLLNETTINEFKELVKNNKNFA